MGVFICHYPSAQLSLKSILCTSHKEKAQTFAIRRTVHHKPHRNMGNLRPKRAQLLYPMFARSKYGGDCAATELMSCKNGMSPLCVAKLIKKLQLTKLLLSNRCIFR